MAQHTTLTITADEERPAVFVARWLVVGLPQDLADALEAYAAGLGPEATERDAVRQVLREVLLGEETSQPPQRPARGGPGASRLMVRA